MVFPLLSGLSLIAEALIRLSWCLLIAVMQPGVDAARSCPILNNTHFENFILKEGRSRSGFSTSTCQAHEQTHTHTHPPDRLSLLFFCSLISDSRCGRWSEPSSSSSSSPSTCGGPGADGQIREPRSDASCHGLCAALVTRSPGLVTAALLFFSFFFFFRIVEL